MADSDPVTQYPVGFYMTNASMGTAPKTACISLPTLNYCWCGGRQNIRGNSTLVKIKM